MYREIIKVSIKGAKCLIYFFPINECFCNLKDFYEGEAWCF